MNSNPTPISRLRRVFQVLIWTGTAVALFYVIENWRGAHAWAATRARLEAKGEILDWQSYRPRSVPDDQNFFGDKTVRDYFAGLGSADPKMLGLPALAIPMFSMEELTSWDAFPWGVKKGQFVPRKTRSEPVENGVAATPAEAFLKWFQGSEPGLNKLRELTRRRSASLNLNYAEPFSDADAGRFMRVRSVSMLLATHARACLVANRPADAWDDLQIIFRFVQAEEVEPYLVAAMVRVALVGLVNEVIVDGIRSRTWTGAQLTDCIRIVDATKVLTSVAHAMRGERAALVFSQEKSSLLPVFERGSRHSLFRSACLRLCPRGWANQYLAKIASGYDQLLDSFDSQTEALTEVPVLKPRHWPPYSWLADRSLPNLAKTLEVAARNQAYIREAQIACALELWKLEKREYPLSLSELVPACLKAIPSDSIKGESFRYLRKDGGYVIYSTGLNRKDDGGDAKRDWVLEIRNR